MLKDTQTKKKTEGAMALVVAKQAGGFFCFFFFFYLGCWGDAQGPEGVSQHNVPWRTAEDTLHGESLGQKTSTRKFRRDTKGSKLSPEVPPGDRFCGLRAPSWGRGPFLQCSCCLGCTLFSSAHWRASIHSPSLLGILSEDSRGSERTNSFLSTIDKVMKNSSQAF